MLRFLHVAFGAEQHRHAPVSKYEIAFCNKLQALLRRVNFAYWASLQINQ
jgi:hypothetical protein